MSQSQEELENDYKEYHAQQLAGFFLKKIAERDAALIEAVKKMRLKVFGTKFHKNEEFKERVATYNRALSDILQLIKGDE